VAGDNLTVSIGADTSKLRADLKLAQVQFQELNKQMTAAAKQAAATGDRTQLDKLSREADAAAKSVAALNRQLSTANKTVANTTPWSAAANAVKGLNAELITLARGAAGGFGFSAIVGLLTRTKDEILEINRLSLRTGFDPTAIKAVNETIEDLGGEAGAGNRALTRLSDAYSKVRQDARAAGEDIGNSVKVLRGSIDDLSESAQKTQRAMEAATGVNTLRGAQRNVQTIKDTVDAFAALQVQWQKFPQTMQGRTDFLQAVIDGFARLAREGKTDLAQMAAAELLGAKSAQEFAAAIKALSSEADGLRKKMAELEAQGRSIGPDTIKNALEYQKALKDVGDALDAIAFAALKAFGPEIQVQAKGLTNDLEAMKRAADDVTYAFQVAAAYAHDIAFPPAATAVIPRADSNLSDLGFAAGGRVRGRGTGTSDSILARLSNGEFVVNAAATSRFLPLLRAINDGMSQPLMPRTSFATGGMVMATDAATGTPVHLHIGGHSFPMRTDSIVAESLIRTAREKQLLSAGRKPSWAGGRRYGG
jgi:predicted  nucleic acid-binding Zn-ribbon protein